MSLRTRFLFLFPGVACSYFTFSGFVFLLKPWDILIFPSCDITHFNLDFEGVRLSLVLHSDKYGDRWVINRNGWLPNDEEDTSDEDAN